MPSEEQGRTQGYLHKILVSGTKAFPYRSGVRLLLGRPENPNAQLAYRLPLPPAGFRYLQGASGDEAASISRPAPSEPGFSVSARDMPQGPQGADPADALHTKPRTQSPPFSLKAIKPGPAPARPAHAAYGMQEKTRQGEGRPSQADPGLQSPKAPPFKDAGAERTRLDIPALATQNKEAPPETRDQGKNKQPNTPPINKAVPEASRPSLSTPQTTQREARPIRPVQDASAFTSINSKPLDLPPERKAMHQAEGLNMERGPEALPAQNKRIAVLPEVEKAIQGLPPRRSRQAAEAQIEQLRQSLQQLKRKTSFRESPEREDRASQADRERTERPPVPHPLPQPVVIVRHAPAQRRTPAAFWERSYLSRLFRVRPLR